ncbi:MAG: diguanylate cyclase [Gammaproteobacteria bacterium]|nr:MAG: diguanylate cyclase [Gammaproteobacteria bacterium]
MKLRLKVLIILASMWTAISLVVFVYSKYTLTHNYARLEQEEGINNLKQTSKTLTSMISALNLVNFDWSQWNDAYYFMTNKNQAFIKSNLAFTFFENAKINLIFFFTPAGKLFYGLSYDLSAKKFIPIPRDLINYLEINKSFITYTDVKANKVGLLKIAHNYLVLSSMPIITSQGTGPIHGTLVMGYFFTGEQLEQLSDIVNMKVSLFPLPLNRPDATLTTAYAALKKGSDYYIAAANQDYLYGYTFICDVNKKPIGMLRITMPRTLYQEGLSTIDHYLAIVISMGIFFLIMIWFLLKIFVLDRIINVSHQVTDISSKSQFSHRIRMAGKDEIETMVAAINSLMEIIELTQEQLKYRIVQRTEELERLSQLNKNLYTEMSHQKQIESQLREDEKVLRQMAYYDALTRLPNRLFFIETLQQMITQASLNGTHLAMLFLDADRLKSINDTYGHMIGDAFLKHTGQRLKHSLRKNDLVARLAGDEFIICLNEIKDKNHINKITETVLSHLSMPLSIDHIIIKPTFSVGISIYPNDGTTIEELEKHADLAMYYAKRQPGNAYCYYDEINNEAETS